MAGAWGSIPSIIAIVCYLVYNKLTVGVAMPLSGATKAGFVGFLDTYLTSAIHFAPILDLKGLLTHKASDGGTIFANSFRFVEVIYPLLAASFGALALWKYRRKEPESSVLFALCLYIMFKTGYNFLNVHPWHQADWYYVRDPVYQRVGDFGSARAMGTFSEVSNCCKGSARSVRAANAALASQYYASIVFQSPESPEDHFVGAEE